MPKILQREICKTVATGTIIGGIQFVIFFIDICVSGWMGNAQIFLPLNIMMIIFMAINIRIFRLPEYLYIAPYSLTKREQLIDKYITKRTRIITLSCVVFGVLPVCIYAIVKGYQFSIFISFTEIVFLYAISLGDVWYQKLENEKSGWLILYLCIIIFSNSFFCALENYSFEDEPVLNGDMIVMLIVMIVCIIAIAKYHISEKKSIIQYYANYELVTRRAN